jgi:RecA-family ATPase
VALEVVRLITTQKKTWFDGITPFDANAHLVVWCEAEGFQAGLRERIQQLEIPSSQIIFPFKDPIEDFRLEKHLKQLEEVIAYHQPDLVTIDSLRGSHTKEEKGSTGMQQVMSQLVSLAKRFNSAILICHHTNKPAPGQPDVVSDINRVRGSSAIAANCRMIWAMDRPDPKDEKVRLKVIKSNLASFPEPMGLIITDDGVDWVKAPGSNEKWDSTVQKPKKEDEAAVWLEEFLKDGPKPKKAVEEEAVKAGHSPATLRRASERPGFITKHRPDKDHDHGRWELDVHSS